MPEPGPTRVLSVIESLGRGGAERLLVTLHRHLPDRFEPSVVSLFGPDPLSGEIEATGARVHRLQGLRTRPLRSLSRLRRVMREFRPHIVHTHLFHANLIGRIAARGLAPVVTSLHNPDYTHEGAGFLGWRKTADRVTSRWTDRFIAVSEAVADDYRRQLGLKEILVLQNFVDVESLRARAAARTREEVRATQRTPHDAPVLVHVGRFSPQKGHAVLVEAFAAVLKHDPRAVLWLVGDGDGRGDIERRCRELGISGAVRFIGSVADPLPYLGAADLFVFPSLFEAFGIALVEAMAVGLPYVATSVGGVPAVVGDGGGGVLVRPGEVEALAEACVELLSDGNGREVLAELARARADRFDVREILPQLIGLYDSF